MYSVLISDKNWLQTKPAKTTQSLSIENDRSKLKGLFNKPFLRFCWTWTKRYLITSQTRVKHVSQIHHRTILRMVRWCSRLTRLTFVCEVRRYRLVQDKISNEKTSGWQPAIAFLYLFLFHSLLCLTFFLSRTKISFNKQQEFWLQMVWFLRPRLFFLQFTATCITNQPRPSQ